MYTSDILKPNFDQIGVGSAEIEFFSSLYPPKTFNTIFSKVHFLNVALYTLIFQVLSINIPCIILEHVNMGAHYPILWKTQNSFFQHR